MFHNQEVLHKIDQNNDELTRLIYQRSDIWVNDVVFTWRWWMAFILTILPWVLWAFYRKKESTDRYLYIAFLVIVITVIFDVFGDQYGMWHYRYNLLPIVPTYFPWDFTLMPVSIITLLQIKPKTNPFIKAVIFALSTSYIAEPFFQWVDVYQPIHWRFIYSVPIQFCLYLLVHRIYQKKFQIDK